jgi:hypothetical protein
LASQGALGFKVSDNVGSCVWRAVL